MSADDDPATDVEGRLFGPTVKYADGRMMRGKALDVERILTQFEHADAESRSAFLCSIAHDLTLAIRGIVYDPSIAGDGIERVKWINESLHQLTSCVNPHHRWSAHDEILLIRGIIENSFRYGFDRWLGHAIAAGAGNAIGAKKPVAAK